MSKLYPALHRFVKLLVPLLPLSFTPNLITVILSTINFLTLNYPVSSRSSMSPRCRCPSLISDSTRRTTTHAADRHAGRWVISVWWQFVYDWRLLKLSAAVLDDWSCWCSQDAWCRRASWRHQAASVIWVSPGVERRDAWRISHAHPTPWCLCIASPVSPMICRGGLPKRRCIVILR